MKRLNYIKNVLTKLKPQELKFKMVLINQQQTKFFVSDSCEYMGGATTLDKFFGREDNISGIEDITTSQKFIKEIPEDEWMDGWSHVFTLQSIGVIDEITKKELFIGDIVKAYSEGSCATFVIKKRQICSPCYILYPAYQHQKFWNIHTSQEKDGKYYDRLEYLGNVFENPELIDYNLVQIFQ